MRKRLYLLSVLLLMVCGQTWASYNNGKPDYGTRCNGNTPTKTVIVDGVMYSLYGNQNYTYSYESYTCGTSGSGNYAVAVYAEQYDTSSELTIKSTIQDGGTTYTVVAIGEQFFWYNNSATKLTIPATVQTLETFALEDNTGNLSEIVIEDSENKLECYRTTNSYGAFSWNSGLKKVYIGRELYAVGGTDYYYYAPFYKGDFTDLEVTLGPLVGCISQYTFYNNSIKSIKAMSQAPPTCGIDAFGGVSSTIPVYVSYKTKDAYSSASGWSTFTNYVFDLELCKADALNDLDAEAGQNPSAAVLAIVSDYKGQVNNATSGDEVVAWLYAGTAAIQLQKAKEAAIAELNAAATTYPSAAAAGIAETYTGIINAATTTDAVNSAKEEGIQALKDAYNAQRLAALDAVTVTQTEADDYSYLLENGVVFEIDGDNVNITVNGADEKEFTLSETDAITICPARTFTLTAIQDPANTSDYYATFYTSEGAYKVPETANAFIGTLLDDEHLMITNTGVIIHKSEAVLMKAGQSDITLMPSCNMAAAAEGNDFIGTDKSKTLGASEFALSFGENGVAFYNWEDKSIGDNTAYLAGDPDVESIAIEIYDGVLVKITNQDDSTVTLIGLKKVEFIKQNGTPAVRVTRGDNTTETYLNPKKVDFGK